MVLVNVLLDMEAYVVATLKWPVWALRVIAALSSLVGVLALIEYVLVPSTSMTGRSVAYKEKHQKFKLFQAKYLAVYIIVMLADWLQGTNMYTLYSSYGVNVGTLFLTGFLSSAVFGTFLGIFVDTWGRRFGCILFCVLEIVINLIEHVPHMPLLMLGRVLGGLSTSLLFSAFESWMVSEHRKEGFAEELLAETFAIASWSNGLAAISAGFMAQIAADINGDIGPFQLAIALTVLALVLVYFWSENYGSSHSTESSTDAATTKDGAATAVADRSTSTSQSITAALTYIKDHPVVLVLGLSQALFEGAMYSFGTLFIHSTIVLFGHLHTGLAENCCMLKLLFLH
jgi:MFS transporter, MFS domain-containing protein family, molybdate-anion transporter